MVHIQRILCPVDFSDASKHALEHAVAIAKWYESQVTALHVMFPRILPQPAILVAEMPNPMESERQAVQEHLGAWLEPAVAAGIKTEVLFDQGIPAPCILQHAVTVQPDLIVMGTHGLSGFDHVVLGSVAEKVLRKATCPVMTVPPGTTMVAKIPYTHLLCPVDFSESSLAALRFAMSLAKESDANLTILHVLDWPADDELLVERLDAPEFRGRVEATARGRLEALITDDERVWCKPVTEVSYGKPYRQILEVAEHGAADLIVMGVRGRNPVDLTLFGSTTNHVVRRASCPVLTLKQ